MMSSAHRASRTKGNTFTRASLPHWENCRLVNNTNRIGMNHMSKQLKNHLLSMLILLLPFLTASAIGQTQNTQIEIEGFDLSALDAKIADAAARANAPGAN